MRKKYSLDIFFESLLIYKETVDIVRRRSNKISFFDYEVTKDDIRLLKEKLLKLW